MLVERVMMMFSRCEISMMNEPLISEDPCVSFLPMIKS